MKIKVCEVRWPPGHSTGLLRATYLLGMWNQAEMEPCSDNTAEYSPVEAGRMLRLLHAVPVVEEWLQQAKV